MNSNKPFVPVRVNGAPPRLFLLDTGSTRASVDQRLIAALGLRVGSVETDTGAGDARIRVSTLQPPACEVLAGAALDHAAIGAFDLSGISSVEGLPIAGLLGGDFLAQYVVRVDYLRRNLRVYPASFRYHGGGKVLPVTIAGGHAFTAATVVTGTGAAATGRFLVDTGYRGAISLNHPFARRHGLPAAADPKIKATTGIGIGGETQGIVFRVRALRLSGVRLNGVITSISTDRGGYGTRTDVAGIIGADVWRRFTVWLDYPHHRIILERTADSGRPFAFDASGMFLLGKGPRFRDVTVFRVIPGSPADRAGIRPGDVLRTINHRRCDLLGLDAVRRLLRATDRTYELQLMRGNAPRNTVLHTRDLLATAAAS